MSADPQQQIDITPYKVIRENVITNNQQKVPEVRPQTTDLATSILDKLTEIKDNLYPSHLNIPPQKFGQPTGYISPLPGSVNNLNPSQAIEHPAEGIETLFRKDTYVSSIQSHSRDHSPDLKSPGSPFYFPSPGHPKTNQRGDLSADLLNPDLAHAIQENIDKKTAMEIRSGSNSPIYFSGQNTLTPPRMKSPLSNPQNVITASITEDLYRANRFEPASNSNSQGGFFGTKTDNSEAFKESLPSTMMNSKVQIGEMGKSGVGSNLQGEIESNSNYSLPQFSSTDVRASNQSAQNNESRPEYSQQRSDLLASVNKAQATFGYNSSKSPANTLASSPAKGNALGSNHGSPHHLPNVNSVVTEEDSYIVAENRANRATNPQQQYSTLPTPKNKPQAEGDDISQLQGSVPQSRRENTGEVSSTRNSQVRTSNSQRNQNERENYEQRDQNEEYQSQPSSISQSRRENVPESNSTRNSQVRSSNSQRDQDNFESGNHDSSKPPRFQDSQRENATVSSIRNSQVRSSNSQRDQGDYEQSNEDSFRPRENIGTESSSRNSQVRSNRQQSQNESDEFQGPVSQNRRENAGNTGEVSSTRNSQVRSNRQGRDSYDQEEADERIQPQGSVSQYRRENPAETSSTRNSQVRSSNQQRDPIERENYDSGNQDREGSTKNSQIRSSNQQDEEGPHFAGSQNNSTRNSQVRTSNQQRGQVERENYEQTNQDEEEPHFAGSQNNSTRNSQVRTSNQQRERDNYEQRNQDEPQNRRENASETRNSQVRSSKQSDQGERYNSEQNEEEYQSQPQNTRGENVSETRNSQVRTSNKPSRDQDYEQTNQDEPQNRRENVSETRNSQVRSNKQQYETNQDVSRPDQRENIASESSTRNSQVRSSKQRDQDEAEERSQPQGSVSQYRRENTAETSSTRNSQVRSNNKGYDQEETEERIQPQGSVPQYRRENTAETSSTRNSQVRSSNQQHENYDSGNQDRESSTRNSQVRSSNQQQRDQQDEEEPHFAVSQNKRENTSETRNSQVRSNNQGRDSYEATNQDEECQSQPQNRRENPSASTTSTRNSQVRTSNKPPRDQDYEQTNQDEPQNRRGENVSSETRNSQVRSNKQQYETNQNVSKPPRYNNQQDDQDDQGSFVQQKQRPEQQNKRYNNEDTEGSVTPKQRADTPSDNGRKPVEEMTLQSRRQKEAEGNLEVSKRRSENVTDKVRQMEKIQELEEMMAQSRKKSQNEPGHSKRRSESHYENLKLQGIEGLPGKRRENADTSEQGSYISKYRSETPSEYSNAGDLSQRSQYGKSEQTTPRKSKKADDPYYEDKSDYVKSRPELQSQGPTPKNSTDTTPKSQFEAGQQKPQGKIISNRVGTNAEQQGAVVPKQKAEQSLGQIVNPQGTTTPPLDAQALDKRFSFGLVVSDVSERESGPDTDSDRRYYMNKQAEEQARNMGVEGFKKKSGHVRGPNTSEDQEQLSNRLEHSSKPNTQREETEEIDERQESQENQDYKDQMIQEEKQFRKERRDNRQGRSGRDQTGNDPQDQPQRGLNSQRSSRVQKLPESLPEESNEESISSSSKIKADEPSDPNDVKQRNFTFVSRTSGTDSSQQMVNNTLSSSAHKMDTDRDLNTERSNQPNESVVVEKKKPTRPNTASISPPRSKGGDFAGGSSGGGGGQMTAYITLEHEKKAKSSKPASLNNINESQPPSVKNIDDPQQQTMNRNSSQMNLSTPNNPKKPSLDNFSPPGPGITLQVPPSGMGTRQHSPMHNQMHAFQNMQNMGMSQSPNPLNPMHPMMNQMGQQMGQMGGHNMFGMSNLSSIPNISNMHTPMNNMNFPNMPNIPMPNFNEGGHAGEYQKYILMMMNYYENHLSNLKTMCVQQNEVLNQEKQKNQNLEHRNSELVKKIQELDSSIKEQYATFENSQKELKTRYEVVLEELSNVKKGLAARQVGDSDGGHAPRPVQVGDMNYQTMLYHEIITLRKDLDNQRQTMYDYRSTSRHLEDQMRDLEKIYIDELKNNVSLSHKREQIQDTLDKYKTDYLKMDTLNRIILDGYERTRKDFEELKSSNNLGGNHSPEQESINREKIDSALNSRERSRQPSVGYTVQNEDKRREVLLRSISPLRYEAEDNKDEMLRNKMRAQESQVKDLLNWNANSSKTPVVYTQTYPAPNNYSHQHLHHNPQHMGHQRGNPILQNTNPITGGGGQNNQMYTSSSQAYGAGNYNSNPRQQHAQMQMQQQQQYNSNSRGQQQRIQPPPQMNMNMNDQRGGRGNITFPSYQKVEDNKDEIQRTDYELSRLTQHRKIIENELFKMPSTAKSLDQKRKKAALEMELEGIDYQIEDCKNKLRKYDVLTAKV